jgi:hypothetical protein
MPLLIDHDASRALAYHTRAIELAEAARRACHMMWASCASNLIVI